MQNVVEKEKKTAAMEASNSARPGIIVSCLQDTFRSFTHKSSYTGIQGDLKMSVFSRDFNTTGTFRSL